MFEPMPTTIAVPAHLHPHQQSHFHQPPSSLHHHSHRQLHRTDFGSFSYQPPPPLSSSLEPIETTPTTTSTAKQPFNQQYQSTYQSFADIADPVQNPHLFIHVASGQKISRPWQAYISDLDDFFERIYRYYRKSGFTCILVEHVLELLEILLVILFTFFFLHCVDYDVLFKKKLPPGHRHDKATLKITISDCLIPLSQVTLNSLEIILLVFAAVFWFTKLGVAVYSILSNYAIRSFFIEALQIPDPSIYSWQEVQLRLIHAQSHCLLRESHLDELAIHNRLLRRANYMIALVNKGVLPIYYRLPILGEYIYLTSGLEFNLQILLFRGIFSLFDTNWKLRDEIKLPAERFECARRFSNRCLAVGLINLILLPMIFIWQSLYTFYTYVEALKRDPTMFGSHTWSRYGRWFCRHFNELDHELDQRLNRGYRPATRYMNSFTAPLLEILARFVTFSAGILLSVLIVLTIYDEDVITVEHVLTLLTGLGAAIAISRAFLPDVEPNRWSFAELDAAILQHIHYRPHNHPPHTAQARKSMANIFVYKSTTILEELFSPLVVPFILMRHLRSRSLEIVDFFRVYTLELADIGDVCMFSQFNFHQNGHRIFSNQQLPSTEQPKPHSSTTKMKSTTASRHEENGAEFLEDDCYTTRNGKLELSLINFKLMNPKWQPHDTSQLQFIDRFTKQSRDDPMITSNLILPMKQLNRDLCESKSMIDLHSQTTSIHATNVGQHEQKISTRLEQSQLKTSRINDSLGRRNFVDSSGSAMGADLGFGFGEERRRLLQLRYASVFSEQEERDNQMALSSLYFHQMVFDSLQQSQQGQGISESRHPETSSSRSLFGHQKMDESIPLLFSEQNQRKGDDQDDDNDDLDNP